MSPLANGAVLAVQATILAVAVSTLTDGHLPASGCRWLGVREGFLNWRIYLDVDALDRAGPRFLTRRGLRRYATRRWGS